MRDKLIHSTGDQRTFVIVLESGEEVMSCLQHFAAAQHIDAAQITAIGAFSDAELAYFDWEHKKYLPNKVDEQVEVAAFAGDVALGPDGKAALHVHCVLGRRDGSALPGHLTRGHVRPTLEIVLIQSPGHLRKRHDADSGLALIDLDSSSP